MKKFKLLLNLTILFVTTTILAQPHTYDYQYHFPEEPQEWVRPDSYDEILQFLDDLESGELEKRHTQFQLDEINDYLFMLAQAGTLPGEPEPEFDYDEPAYDNPLEYDNPLQYLPFFEHVGGLKMFPASLHGDANFKVIKCGKVSNAWKKTKKFVKKHKKAIIIGAVVIVAVTAVTIAVVAASSASVAGGAAAGAATTSGSGAVGGGAGTAAAGALGAAGASLADADPKATSKKRSPEPTAHSHTPPAMPTYQSLMEDKINTFKENLAQEQFFKAPTPGQGLSLEETGRAIGPLFAQDAFNHLNTQLKTNPSFAQEMRQVASQNNITLPPRGQSSPTSFGHSHIDNKFGTVTPSPIQNTNANFNALAYQSIGETAHSHGYYNQAVGNFTKAIDINPTDPMSYLNRGSTYFSMGEYDKSIDDFKEFSSQAEAAPEKIPFSPYKFTKGFVKGLPKGVYDSGEGLALFVADAVKHPIQTTKQMYHAMDTLAQLVKDDKWGMIAEALSPEIHKLATEWDTLPSETRGELAGYALGKHGADILIPGAAAKIAGRCAKSAQELAAIARQLKIAESTLLLETAAEVGSAAKVGEIINTSKKTAFLGDELGFTAKEMGQLQKAGQLENTVATAYEHLSLPKQKSIDLFAKAESFLKQHKGFKPEHEIRGIIHKTGLPTFPRPKGIPENFRVKLSDNGGGMKYVHPKHTHTSVRVMPGKAHSPWPQQQSPYVVHKKNGDVLDKYGNIVKDGEKAIEAHIPLEEFVCRN